MINKFAIGEIVVVAHVDTVDYNEGMRIGDILKIESIGNFSSPSNGIIYYFENRGSGLFENQIGKLSPTNLEVGYILQLRNGKLFMIMNGHKGIVFVGDSGYTSLSSYDVATFKNKNRIDGTLDIMKIYGFTSYSAEALKLKIGDRPLIWERNDEIEEAIQEPKEMTMEQLTKALGYPIKIVKGE